jgi:hypothetical protein
MQPRLEASYREMGSSLTPIILELKPLGIRRDQDARIALSSIGISSLKQRGQICKVKRPTKLISFNGTG